MRRELKRLEQRHEVDGPPLERGARLERQPVDDEVALPEVAPEPLVHRLAEGQEARAELVGSRAEPEVEARRLELLVGDR